MAARKKKVVPLDLVYTDGDFVYSINTVTRIREIADNLGELFRWEATEEGDMFWEEVTAGLYRIAESIRDRLGTPGDKL